MKSFSRIILKVGSKSNESALENIAAEVLVVSFTSDWMFPTSNGKEICLASIKANKKCSYIELEGEHGHDSFLYPNDDSFLAHISFEIYH